MLSSFYTISSAVVSRQHEIDTIGNNLINSQTPGYQAERVILGAFEQEVLKQQSSKSNIVSTANFATATVVSEIATLTGSGLLKQTGRQFDCALNCNGYFNIQGNDGITYLTRNGQFDVDDEGYLCLPGAGRVLGAKGEIKIDNLDFYADVNGNLYNSKGNLIDELLIMRIEDNQVVQKSANGMIVRPENAQRALSNEISLMQGCVELSNVDYNQEMALLIESQRAFQTCSSALQIIDGINRKSVQIASV